MDKSSRGYDIDYRYRKETIPPNLKTKNIMISYSNELAEYSKAWNNLSSKIELTIKYIMNEHKVKELDLTDSEFFGHFYDYIDYVYKTYQVTGIYIDYEDCLVIETNNGEIEPSEMSLIDLTALIKEVLNVLDED